MDADTDNRMLEEASRSDVAKAESPVYSPAQAAGYLNLKALGVRDPVAGVCRLVKAGKLECFAVLGHRAFTQEQLDRCVQQLIEKSKQRKSRKARRS